MLKYLKLFSLLCGIVFCSSTKAVLIEQGVSATYRFDLSGFGVDPIMTQWDYDGPANSVAPAGYDFLDVGGGMVVSFGTTAFASDIFQYTFVSPFSIPVANFVTGFRTRVSSNELFMSIDYFNDSFTFPGLAIRIEDNDPSQINPRVIGELAGIRTVNTVSAPSGLSLLILGGMYCLLIGRKKRSEKLPQILKA